MQTERLTDQLLRERARSYQDSKSFDEIIEDVLGTDGRICTLKVLRTQEIVIFERRPATAYREPLLVTASFPFSHDFCLIILSHQFLKTK